MNESLLDVEIKLSLESSFIASMKKAKTFDMWKDILNDARVEPFLGKSISVLIGNNGTQGIATVRGKNVKVRGGAPGGATHTLNALLYTGPQTRKKMFKSVEHLLSPYKQLDSYIKRHLNREEIEKIEDNDEGGTYRRVG